MEDSEVPQEKSGELQPTEIPASDESSMTDAFSMLLSELQFRRLLSSHVIPDGALDRVTRRLLEEWSPSRACATFDSVSVPTIMAEVASSTSDSVDLEVDESSVLSPSSSVQVRKISGRTRWSRRFFLAAASTAVVGGIVAWNQLRRPPQTSTRTLSPESLMMTGVSLFDAAVTHQTWGTGALVHESEQPMLAERTQWPRESFGPFPIVRQREEPNFFGRTAIAYDIRHYTALMGTLFAITSESLWNVKSESRDHAERFVVEGLGSRIPEYAMHPTAGRCASTWQESHRLFVLVVAGQPDDYRRFLTPPMTGILG